MQNDGGPFIVKPQDSGMGFGGAAALQVADDCAGAEQILEGGAK